MATKLPPPSPKSPPPFAYSRPSASDRTSLLPPSTPTRTPSRFSSTPPMQANMVVLDEPPTGLSLGAPRSPPVSFWQAERGPSRWCVQYHHIEIGRAHV